MKVRKKSCIKKGKLYFGGKKERGGKNQSGGFISPFAGLARSLILPLAKRNSLPENVVLNRTYKQRAAQKNQRRRARRGKGLGSTIKKLSQNPVARKIGKGALKRAPGIYDKLTKKIKY